MVKVVWTQRALDDLKDIGDYISKDSFKYAKITLEKLVETASIIENYPLLGRFVPEINDKTIREIIKGNYRVIYQIRKETSIFILTVFHSARSLTTENLK
ncbi:MAG: type II toxin-antitoxin system RelE/ParE family toxin [Draconibacterium sp.]|jgi:addiction module RelE/StbE family toxin|nr:type II toxin-antitoxin system RelE/ParE family toxin [Draconibacterium sp.]